MIDALRSSLGRIVSTGHVRWSEFAWPVLLLAAGKKNKLLVRVM